MDSDFGHAQDDLRTRRNERHESSSMDEGRGGQEAQNVTMPNAGLRAAALALGRGNTPVRSQAMMVAQQTHGNHALSRALNHATPVQRQPNSQPGWDLRMARRGGVATPNTPIATPALTMGSHRGTQGAWTAGIANASTRGVGIGAHRTPPIAPPFPALSSTPAPIAAITPPAPLTASDDFDQERSEDAVISAYSEDVSLGASLRDRRDSLSGFALDSARSGRGGAYDEAAFDSSNDGDNADAESIFNRADIHDFAPGQGPLPTPSLPFQHIAKRHARYAGEDTRASHFQTAPNVNINVNYLKSEQEREDYKVNVGEGGKLYQAGDLLSTGNAQGQVPGSSGGNIFAMSPAGAMYSANLAEEQARGKFDGKDASIEWQNGRFVPKGGAASANATSFHHTSFLGGGDVGAAGEMKVNEGVLSMISNASGHYTPKSEHIMQALAQLEASGASTEQARVHLMGDFNPATHHYDASKEVTSAVGEYKAAGGSRDALAKRHNVLGELRYNFGVGNKDPERAPTLSSKGALARMFPGRKSQQDVAKGPGAVSNSSNLATTAPEGGAYGTRAEDQLADSSPYAPSSLDLSDLDDDDISLSGSSQNTSVASQNGAPLAAPISSSVLDDDDDLLLDDDDEDDDIVADPNNVNYPS